MNENKHESIFIPNLQRKDLFLGYYLYEIISFSAIAIIILIASFNINSTFANLYIGELFIIVICKKNENLGSIAKTISINFRYMANEKVFIDKISGVKYDK